MLFNNRFILASSSRSRYNILTNLGLSFERIIPQCDEEKLKEKLIKKEISPDKICLELARCKSKSISKFKKNKLVVGSDTIIKHNGNLLSKALNKKDAIKKILSMSGKSHDIYSSVSVYYNSKEIWNETQKTLVKIRKLSTKDVEKYILKAGKEILKSVGCYQLEKLGPNIIENIKGDFFNVMGFPLFPFLNFLKKYKNNNKVK